MNDVLKKVLERITPSKEERMLIKEISNEIISLLSSVSKDVEIVLGGSASRETNLKGNFDLDIFMRFKSEEDIKKRFKNIVRSVFKDANVVHGTREYFRFKYKGFKVEIVPSVKYEHPSKAKNSSDISFFHINYLKKHITNNMKKEVLLLKQFLKANDVYGAESARGGFSGYVCELLIIKFKTFMNLLKFIEQSKPKIIIDIENHYKNEKDVLKSLDKNKTKGPLIVVDPQLPDRNAGACVSYEAFSNFVYKARYFIRTKDIRLFNIRGLNIQLIKERSERRGTKLIKFKIKKKGEFNVIKAKALRRLKQLVSILDKEGWDIYNYGVSDDKYIFIEFESLKVSKAKRHYGPYVWVDSKNFDNFLKKWEDKGIGKPYVYKNRIVVDVFRKQNIKQEIKEYMIDYL